MQDFFAHETASMMVAGLVRVQRYGIIVISCPDVCLEKDAISVRMW